MKRYAFLLIALLLMAFGASAQPEQPLDLPAVDDAQAWAVVALKPLAPLDGEYLGYIYDIESDIRKFWYISWESANIAIDKYVVKMRDLTTGQRFKFTLNPENCSAKCELNMTDVGRLEVLTDNHEYTWQVIGKNENNEVVARSGKQKIRVEKISEPVTMYPYAGAQASNITTFGWVQGFDAVQYQLIIKNKLTGETVFKSLYKVEDLCAYTVCEVEFEMLSEKYNLLNNGAKYKWMVKAIGPAGDTAKSPWTTVWKIIY